MNKVTRHASLHHKILFLIASVCLFCMPEKASAQFRINMGEDSPLRKLQLAEMAIEALYVDSVDANKVVEDGIRGMLEKLDPHSNYSTPKEMKQLTEPLQGNFEGIGVQFNIVEDTLLVLATIHNGPSEKVGIMGGDRIIAVNDTAIAGVKMERNDIMQRLRGKKGTKVNVTVVRRSEKEPLHFTITRDKIPLTSLDAAYMIEPEIGYIRLGSFGATTHKEMMTAVDSLRQHGMRHLILDLQDNGGGYLSAAEDIANEFLPEGDMIVYSEGRTYGKHEKRANGKGRLQQGKVVVLTNEYTASAAEIVSGAIQDQDRGIIVGRRSFGKGLVQRPIELPDGSMIRLTVAHYYTPSGRCIQKPYKAGERKEYSEDVEQRFKHGELTCRDSIHFDDSLRYETLREHRTVYGGGGIMPDEFVPLDTLQYTRYHRMLTARGVINDVVIRYFDNNRKRLKKQYTSLDTYIRDFEVPQSLIDDIMAEGKKKDIKIADSTKVTAEYTLEMAEKDEMERTMPYLRTQLKALLGRDIFDMAAFYRIMNPLNATFRRAVEVIKD